MEGRDDAMEFAGIKSAMKVLMFGEEEQWQMFRLLAAFLHIGNFVFGAREVDNLDAVEITNPKELQRASRLLQVSSNDGSMRRSIVIKRMRP